MESPIDYADPQNSEDQNYYRKHATSLPPEESHMIIPAKADLVNTEKNKNARLFFYGWNNLSEFETKSLLEMR